MTAPSATMQPGAAFPASRLAVSGLFLLNGYVMGNWAPKIPEFAARLGLEEGALGVFILVFGIGSMVAMPAAGALMARLGSRPLVRPLALATAFAMLAVSLAPTPAVAAVVVFFLGMAVGGMDVTMNANAVAVERSMGRSIMSSCHGFWSLGALAGSFSGGWLIASLGVLGHSLLVTAAGAAVLAAIWRSVMADAPGRETDGHSRRLPLSPLPWLVGLMALFSMIPEGAILDWAAFYLRQERGASLTQSGFAFGAFSTTMAVMRFAGDGVRDRIGAVTTLRLCTLLAMAGMVLAGLSTTPGLVIAGFAICGIGISNMVPIAFSAAGNLPGFAPGVALSVVTFMGYSGILFAPAVIGSVAERTGFAAVFLALPVLFAVVLLLSPLATHADQA